MSSYRPNSYTTYNSDIHRSPEIGSPPTPNFISEITQIIRSIVLYYTENISQYNRIISEGNVDQNELLHTIESYNRNINTFMTLLNNIIELYILQNRISEISVRSNRSEQSTRRSVANSRRRHGLVGTSFFPHQGLADSTTMNRHNMQEFSNLIYLLNMSPTRFSDTTIQTPGDATSGSTELPLTLTQIINATEIIHYSESLGERRCPISLDDFIPNEQICQIRGCKHIFKPVNLLRWFERHTECPVCRYDLRYYLRNTQRPSVIQNTESAQQEPEERDRNQSQPETSGPVRRNISISEFLPLLDNILSSAPSPSPLPQPSTTGTQNDVPHTESSGSNLMGLLNNRFSQVLSDIILEQIPSIDSSNNLLYTIEIPLTMPQN